MSMDEFKAARRVRQERFAERLMPLVEAALASGDWSEVIAESERLYRSALELDDTEFAAKSEPDFKAVKKALDEALSHATPESDPKVTALMIAVATINAAAIEVARQNDLDLEWVTMHDNKVREAHDLVDGQRRKPGKAFSVSGVQMPYPGWPLAPIELWINCRCTLRPSSPAIRASGACVRHDDVETLGGVMDSDTVEVVEEQPITAADATPVPWHGVLAPEGIMSGDGRMFSEGALRNRDLPLPLTWQKVSDDGHKQNIVVAKIEKMEKIDGLVHASGHFINIPEADEVVGLIAEFGRFGVSIDADEAVGELSDEGNLVFSDARISAACIVAIPAFAEAYVALGSHPVLDAVTAAVTPVDDAPEGSLCAHEGCEATPTMAADTDTENWSVLYCAEHAEQHDGQSLDDLAAAAEGEEFGRGPGWVTNPTETRRLHRYWTQPGQPGYAKIGWGAPGDFNRCRALVGEKIAANSPEDTRFLNQICAQWHHDALGFWPGEHHASVQDGVAAAAITITAGGGFCAPSEWFEDPKLEDITPLTVTEDGHVFGHLAEWHLCHIGISGVCTEAPRSNSDYAYFRVGQIDTDKGPVAVGSLVIGTGHAALSLGARPAAAHYDNTGTAWADVAIGEDEFGIWVNGWTRPGLSKETLYAARASGRLSGDWREIKGELELVAALSVNTGGFPIPRPQVGVAAGMQNALVAAGLVTASESGEIKVTVGMTDEDKAAIAAAVVAEMRAAEQRAAQMAALRQKVGQ